MKIVKHVPNTLSALRIVLSVALLYLVKWPWVFTAVYLVNGLTDVLDGKIARRFHVESKIGSVLDAIGDSLLFACAAISLFFLAEPKLRFNYALCLSVLGVAVAYKVANVFVTYARFKQFNMMHTLMNKSVFVSFFFFVPVFLILQEINFWMILAISILICLACLEETVTLFKLKEYNVNCKGVLAEKLLHRRKETP